MQARCGAAGAAIGWSLLLPPLLPLVLLCIGNLMTKS